MDRRRLAVASAGFAHIAQNRTSIPWTQLGISGRLPQSVAVGVWQALPGRPRYHDFASGVRDDRPGLDSCLRALRKGDVLVVWKLDRLGRNLARFRRGHRLQAADGGRAAADQAPNVGPVANRVGLRAADGDDDCRRRRRARRRPSGEPPTSLRRSAPWKSSATIAASTKPRRFGRLGALEAAAGATRPAAGGEHGGDGQRGGLRRAAGPGADARVPVRRRSGQSWGQWRLSRSAGGTDPSPRSRPLNRP